MFGHHTQGGKALGWYNDIILVVIMSCDAVYSDYYYSHALDKEHITM